MHSLLSCLLYCALLNVSFILLDTLQYIVHFTANTMFTLLCALEGIVYITAHTSMPCAPLQQSFAQISQKRGIIAAVPTNTKVLQGLQASQRTNTNNPIRRFAVRI